ncbi:MAG: exodeoxyribonuclease VII large subunit [Akkermansia sp.]|nr:exodeoxyribonuclease VII large subunit [Akkermansia sp.]
MPLSVTELVSRLKSAVEYGVGEQCVVGEVGSCKMAGSGHTYFTVKDASAQLQCVFYRYQAMYCRVRLREGMLVELTGKPTVWEGRGSLQFVVSSVREAGLGSLQQQFEALKRKLEAEGLFSPARKKPIPRFPKSVGLITSASGAVIQDMRHRLESRAPWMLAYLYPVQVQGRGAELGIARAIEQWNQAERFSLPQVDYLIIARGGGSLEDLWCFNEESLARAIAASKLPVVSAVGHETDFTIADFVADLRAPTPTAAIELTTPDSAELTTRLQQTEAYLRRACTRALEHARLRLRLAEQGPLRQPLNTLAPFAQRLDVFEEELRRTCREHHSAATSRLQVLAARVSPRALYPRFQAIHHALDAALSRMHHAVARKMESAHAALRVKEAELRAVSPQNALNRGFALVRKPDGTLARNAAELPPGTPLHITLSQGVVDAEVK